MKSVMILGGGVMQLPSIKIAKDSGWRVILADGNDRAPGREFADVFEHIDLKDREAMEAAARRHQEAVGLDGVFTAGTDFSATVAWVAEKLNLPGIPYETALKASRKGLMRQALADAGVPVPLFVALEKGDSPAQAVEKLSFPLVVKPVDNMGARGIRRVETLPELEEAFRRAGEYSLSGKVIIEEFIKGPEFSLDALVENGEITVCGIADRHIFFPPYFIEMGHTMPTTASPADVQEIVRVFKAGIRAIGIDLGAAKGDIKLSHRGAVVGEIAARLSGGFMSGWTFPYASGVEVTRGGLNLAVGLPAGDLSPSREWYSAERALISIPGVVEEIRGFEAGLEVPGVEFSHQAAFPGKETVFPRNNVEKCGNFISRAPSRFQAVDAAETACRNVEIVLTPGDKRTLSFLLKEEYAWVPDAYSDLSDGTRAAVEAMDPVSSGFIEKGFEKIPGKGASFRIAGIKDPESEEAFDWHGLSFSAGLERCREAGGCFVPDDSREIGSLFWKAFFRGGYQGGIWLLRSLGALKSKEERKAFTDRWNR